VGLDSLLLWFAWFARVFAVVVPLFLAIYGFVKNPRDNRLVTLGLIISVIVATSWFLGARRDAERSRQVEALQNEIEASKEPAQRGFNRQNREFIIKRLSAINGPSIFVVANGADDETGQYARDITALFKEAGWSVPPSFGMMFAPIVLPGEAAVATDVILGVTPEVPDHITQAVFDALREGQVDIRLGPHWPGTEHPMSILIGPRAKSD
jgi:hypothetical protein